MLPRRRRAQRPSSQERWRRTISYPTSPTKTPSKAARIMAALSEVGSTSSAPGAGTIGAHGLEENCFAADGFPAALGLFSAAKQRYLDKSQLRSAANEGQL